MKLYNIEKKNAKAYYIISYSYIIFLDPNKSISNVQKLEGV